MYQLEAPEKEKGRVRQTLIMSKDWNLAKATGIERRTRVSQLLRPPPINDRSRKKAKQDDSTTSRSTFPKNDNDQAGSEHAETMRRQAQAFDERRPANVEVFQESTQRRIDMHAKLNATIQNYYQEIIDERLQVVAEQHLCCGGLAVERHRLITIIGMEQQACVEVTNYTCSCCDDIFTVHPYDVDCAPTTPTVYCTTWLTFALVKLHRELHLLNGLSADGKPRF